VNIFVDMRYINSVLAAPGVVFAGHD